jgi:four helix bundle suffix protein
VAAMKKLAREHNDSGFYMQLIGTRPPETIANIALCLQRQTDFLLKKLLATITKNFVEHGGFREKMTKTRIDNRYKKS